MDKVELNISFATSYDHLYFPDNKWLNSTSREDGEIEKGWKITTSAFSIVFYF